MTACLTIAGWMASAAILLQYWFLARDRTAPNAWRFDVANAWGGVVLLTGEVVAGAWGVLPLTAAFTGIGFYGWVRGA